MRTLRPEVLFSVFRIRQCGGYFIDRISSANGVWPEGFPSVKEPVMFLVCFVSFRRGLVLFNDFLTLLFYLFYLILAFDRFLHRG